MNAAARLDGCGARSDDTSWTPPSRCVTEPSPADAGATRDAARGVGQRWQRTERRQKRRRSGGEIAHWRTMAGDAVGCSVEVSMKASGLRDMDYFR